MLQRAVWRWHLVAGLFVLPFLGWLAVTGALYLYKTEIERAVYAEWLSVEARPTLPIGTLVASVGAETGARVVQVARPSAPEAWRMTVAAPNGTRRLAFVDPGDGRVLGLTRAGGITGVLRELHSLAITGPIGNALIEIAAGWAIVLVLTGFWLWAQRPRLTVRGSPNGRGFWRDLHGSTGALGGAVVLFLAITGMPWSGVWGRGLQSLVTAQGWGRPTAPAGEHGGHGGHGAALPWSMQHAAMPMGGAGDIGPDRALAAARGVGTAWTMTLPATPGAPYLFSALVARADDAHVVAVDAASGRIVQDARYADFGAGARAIEWGIAVHQGQQYGEPNRLVMLAACAALLLLVVSAPVMWWRRRPRGLGMPPGGTGRGLGLLMAAAGAAFPLTGLTMLAALGLVRVQGWLGGR
ncbi:PepSY domain-containing protein [Sphingomonas sp. Y38-1Y]|uniref:PepSY-associated TM helix domain-containing protein n=1 Tax=Sphingomonas sp. Y38-1Y TaxID=3078265 RepID=UPI0028E6CC93|nr:PepSY domain-containing protein [Sphingomonas sp. Y38-1Y]